MGNCRLLTVVSLFLHFDMRHAPRTTASVTRWLAAPGVTGRGHPGHLTWITGEAILCPRGLQYIYIE